MERYTVKKEVGDGTFGSVWRAINKQSGEVVAIKRMKKKYYSWEECMNLREVRSLRKMNHPNIVKLKEVVRENDVLYFVFEYMECNLYELMKDRKEAFSEAEVRNWCLQIFQALAYIHERGYFHRDLKPENLLVTKSTIKVADFGLAREVSSQPPFTEYVSTRWYRAPEVLLQASVYGSAVDMWAMGAIMAELFTLRPLFPGSNEADEIYKICSVIGTPDLNSWAEGLKLASLMQYHFPEFNSVHLSAFIPSASEDAIHLISSLCSWNPNRRPKAAEVLQHSFFQPCYYIQRSPVYRGATRTMYTPSSVCSKGSTGQENTRRCQNGPIYCAKPVSNFSTSYPNPSLRAGVQRRLGTDDQLYWESGRTMRFDRIQPQVAWEAERNQGFSGLNGAKVSDITEKLAYMTVNSNTAAYVANKPLASVGKYTQPKMSSMIQQPGERVHPMKAGGWYPEPEYLHQQNFIPSARGYSRKVVG